MFGARSKSIYGARILELPAVNLKMCVQGTAVSMTVHPPHGQGSVVPATVPHTHTHDAPVCSQRIYNAHIGDHRPQFTFRVEFVFSGLESCECFANFNITAGKLKAQYSTSRVLGLSTE